MPDIPSPRLLGWITVSVALTLAVAAIAPQQIPVSLYKLNLIALAGVAGYWLDRSLFPYARPDAFLPDEHVDDMTADTADVPLQRLGAVYGLDLLAAAAMLRRALIVAAAMIAVGLGA